MLTLGFHWDVKPKKQGEKIYTPGGIWQLGTYINVHPDATIIAGGSKKIG